METPEKESRLARRWAIVRLTLGFLQMFGAVFSLCLFLYTGVKPATIAAVLVTGMFTGVSMLLFQVLKYGQQRDANPTGQSPQMARTTPVRSEEDAYRRKRR